MGPVPFSTSSSLRSCGSEIEKKRRKIWQTNHHPIHDNDVSYELIQLKGKDEKDDEGSDSGYSGRSPDGTIRDSKSPSSEVDVTDRKSSFSDDVSEEEEEEEEEVKVPLVPEIIVVKEGGQQEERLPEEEIPRQAMLRQRSR